MQLRKKRLLMKGFKLMGVSAGVPTSKFARTLAFGLLVAVTSFVAGPGVAQQAPAPKASPLGSPFGPPVKPAALTAAPQTVAVPNDPADSNWASSNNAYATAAALRAKGDKQGACTQIQAAMTSLTKVKASHPHSQDMMNKAKTRFCGP